MLGHKLDRAIKWRSSDPDIQRFLELLQGNILKGHGRRHTVNFFCRFGDGSQSEALKFLRSEALRVRSAKEHLQAARDHDLHGTLDTKPFVSIFFSQAGYEFLGIPADKSPDDPAFRAGMDSRTTLNDPAVQHWDRHLQAPHALILVGVIGANDAQTESTRLLNAVSAIGGVSASGDEIGTAYHNKHLDGLEHFGYVDGRSQPLMLIEDVQKERHTDGINNWDPEFPVSQFVVRDKGVDDPHAFGSYFVFRKLEQNVEGFKTAEDILQGKLPGLKDEVAGAMVVGRFEDGSPIAIHDIDGIHPVTNNFNYEGSDTAPKCPLHAHIRKANPRTDDTRGPTMARRGITYGERPHHGAAGKPEMFILDEEPEGARPTAGVGLLFQAYQASLEDQFEVIQGVWANTPARPDKLSQKVGVDPVIGQHAPSADRGQVWPKTWRGTPTEQIDFFATPNGPSGPFVKMLGGGYFFAPSLPSLQAL